MSVMFLCASPRPPDRTIEAVLGLSRRVQLGAISASFRLNERLKGQSYFIDREYLCKGTINRSKKCCLHALGRNGDTAEGLRFRRTCVMREQALKPEIGRSPNRSVNTHVRHHSNDGQAGDALFPQMLEQGRFPKGVWIMLPDDHLAGLRSNAGVDFHTRGVGKEKCRARMDGDMLNVNDR